MRRRREADRVDVWIDKRHNRSRPSGFRYLN
jgi:hypothetical protein